MIKERNPMLNAVRDMVIVELEYAEKVGSIIIPDVAKQYHGPVWGRVVSVGPDYKHGLKPGDKVYYRRHEGYVIRIGEKIYMALKEKWVAATEKKEGEDERENIIIDRATCNNNPSVVVGKGHI